VILTAYNWSASGAGNANVAGNWTPNGVPAASDTTSFSETSVVNCNWNIAKVSTIVITANYTGLIDFAQNATIATGLTIASEGRIKSSSASTIAFDGTPAYNSNKTYILNTCADPFDSATSRDNLAFLFKSSTSVRLDAGIYPHLQCDAGFRPEYIDPSLAANKYTVKLLSLNISANCTPTSPTPTANDRLMNWIIEDVADFSNGANQFATNEGRTHDMGYGTWTFQAKSGGWPLPITGSPHTGGSTFTWRKIIIASTKGGNGSYITIPYGSILSLNDLTINSGAGMVGSNTLGATIHLVNRPTIKGTWGFYPIADGIYYYKGLYNLNVAFGGTGLASVSAGRIPFGNTAQSLNTSAQLTFASNTLHADKGIKLTEVADHPIAAAAGTGLIWVKNTAPSTLIFTNDAGTDTTLGAGGGGGSGDITGVTIQTDTGAGAKATDTGGSADFTLVGSTGVGITNSGATITAVAVPAEIDHDALSNFVAEEHVDWAGASAGTIHASNYTDTTTNTQLSNAQVRTAVEAATDSNVFTNADHTKLNNSVSAAEAINAVQGESTLDLTGVVKITSSTDGEVLRLESTDSDGDPAPIMTFKRTSATPVNGDNIGIIQFLGTNSDQDDGAGTEAEHLFADMYARMNDITTGTEDGEIYFRTLHGGTLKRRLDMNALGVVFNEESLDMNFRVESNGNANMLVVDGGTDKVGIGVLAPTATLDVVGDVRFRASVEICDSDPAPANIETGTIYQFTKGSAGVFTLPASPPVGTQFVVMNMTANDIVITRPHASVKINGATANKTNTTQFLATSIVAVVSNGDSSEWLVMGGI